jgi:multiple sugar transport system permease protein
MGLLIMRRNNSLTHRDQIIRYTILIFGAALAFLPFLYMVLSAFKSPGELDRIPPTFWPQEPTLANFDWVFNTINFLNLFKNSLIMTLSITVLVVYTSALVGFVFEKYRFPGRNLLFFAIIATMFIPNQITRIVIWSAFNRLDLLNTYAGLILPFIYSAFGIFLLRQHMHTIPDDLLDAARIDGASEIGIFHRIVLPNSWAIMSALTIFTFMWSYDEFFWPLIALDDASMYTVPLGLSFFQGQYYNNPALALAGTTVAVIPTLVVFLLFQRHIVDGVTMTGLKG